jgi:hypothetical protein
MFGIPDVKPHGILMWAFCIQAAMPGAKCREPQGTGDIEVPKSAFNTLMC